MCIRDSFKDVKVRVKQVEGQDYFCITDLAKYKNPARPDFPVGSWINAKPNLDAIHEWELLYNPDFKPSSEGGSKGYEKYLVEHFSVVDVVAVLSESPNPRNYWNMLKKRDNQLYTICVQLKLPAADGKKYKTDCANRKGIFRIIQSIPSPNAEPFKLWLAATGDERMEEIEDPAKAMDR